MNKNNYGVGMFFKKIYYKTQYLWFLTTDSMTKEEALDKMQRYCGYQDRCHQEVRTKLLTLKIYGDLLEEIMSDLISEGYLNEERFARNYARGKYRIKGWGKIKLTGS